MRVQYLGGEDLLEEGMATTLVFLPGKSHGQRSLVATVHGVTKSWTRLSASHFDFQCEVYEGEGHFMTGTVLGVPGTCPGWLVCSVGWSNGLRDDSSFSGVNGPT